MRANRKTYHIIYNFEQVTKGGLVPVLLACHECRGKVKVVVPTGHLFTSSCNLVSDELCVDVKMEYM